MLQGKTFQLWDRTWVVSDARPTYVPQNHSTAMIAIISITDSEPQNVVIRGITRHPAGVWVNARVDDTSVRYITNAGDLTPSNRDELLKAFNKAVPHVSWLTREETLARLEQRAPGVGESQAAAAWRNLISWHESRDLALTPEEVARLGEAMSQGFAERAQRGH